MAKLPALVTALAATDGRERVTLDLIARLVREKGLIVTTKSGRAAANMTVSDAVSFLIGAYAVQHPKWAADAAQQYRTFKQSPHGRREKGPVFEQLANANTLADALAVLIERANALEAMFAGWVARAYPMQGADPIFTGIAGPTLSVTFATGSVHISVVVRTGPDFEKEEIHDWLFQPDVDLLFGGFYSAAGINPDRRVSTTIGLRTFLSLHRVMFPAGTSMTAGSGTGAP